MPLAPPPDKNGIVNPLEISLNDAEEFADKIKNIT